LKQGREDEVLSSEAEIALGNNSNPLEGIVKSLLGSRSKEISL